MKDFSTNLTCCMIWNSRCSVKPWVLCGWALWICGLWAEICWEGLKTFPDCRCICCCLRIWFCVTCCCWRSKDCWLFWICWSCWSWPLLRDCCWGRALRPNCWKIVFGRILLKKLNLGEGMNPLLGVCLSWRIFVSRDSPEDASCPRARSPVSNTTWKRTRIQLN